MYNMTMTRLVRWRLRAWASCFLACRFPIEDEPEHRQCSSQPSLPVLRNNSMAFEAKRKLSRRRKGHATRGLNPAGSSSQEEAYSSAKNDMNIAQPIERRSDEDSNWSNSVDEEYIIFNFGEDGAFEVLKSDKPDEASTDRLDCASRNSRPVNRKLNYEKNTKTVRIERCSIEERIAGRLAYETNYPTNHGDCIISPQKESEEENLYLDAESVSEVNFERLRVASVKSSDSTQSSNASTSSFAFPALRWEWIGSPERMPNSEGLSLRKHKARCVGFQCCRF